MANDMRASRLPLIAFIGLLALFGLTSLNSSRPEPDSLSFIEGEVRDGEGPVAGALVRRKGRPEAVLTDDGGRFRLTKHGPEAERVTAWKAGYFIAGAVAKRKQIGVELRSLPVKDCENYSWVDPTPNHSLKTNCGNCHAQIYQEWSQSGHAHSATNRRFLSLYDGTDWHGKPGVGWSLRDEHPDGVGVCTACHAPTVPTGDPAYFDLSKAQEVARQGVHCDYCHKIADAGQGTIGLTHGRFGLDLLRPAKGQLFFGPLDDVDRGEDAYSPLYKDSRYCASCHEGTVFGVHVYSTYSEWQESPARREGKQCQSCHMTPTGKMTNIAPSHGGIERDPKTLGNHRFFAGSQLKMLRESLKLSASVEHADGQAMVEVELRADGAGHRVPTGFVDRHLLLLIEATDADGKPLPPRKGPLLPGAAGLTLAGLPGKLYAKLLSDFDGNRPVPFWRAGGPVEDTRLVPGQPDRMVFHFPVELKRARVRLLYRRTWEEVARSKKWRENEWTVFERTLEERDEPMR